MWILERVLYPKSFVLYSWQNEPDKSDFVGIILMNWSKAYACLLHVLLAGKSEAYDISRKHLIVPYSYLISKRNIRQEFTSQLLFEFQILRKIILNLKNISNNLRNGWVLTLSLAISNNYVINLVLLKVCIVCNSLPASIK